MKIKMIVAALAALLMFPLFSATAYAGGGGEEPPEQPPSETAVPEAEQEPNPFTPAGTGTVVDTATDADGKVFYTIITPDENVFYLVIDHQRGSENVYFLNAVTEADLMALAVPSENNGESAIPGGTEPVESVQPTEPDPAEPELEAELEPEQGGNTGLIILVVVIVMGAGGAAYYFKIYRPKQEAASGGEYEDNGPEADADADDWGDDVAPWPGDEDAPPWDEDEAIAEAEAREAYQTHSEEYSAEDGLSIYADDEDTGEDEDA